MNLNKVILGGNLTRDPESRQAGNSTVCSFGMAINRKWRNRDNELQEDVCFVDVETWGRTAENIQRYFGKGDPILVVGRLKLDQWEDKQSGQNRSKLKVVAEEFQFVGGKRQRNTAPAGDDSVSEDDIPF